MVEEDLTADIDAAMAAMALPAELEADTESQDANANPEPISGLPISALTDATVELGDEHAGNAISDAARVPDPYAASKEILKLDDQQPVNNPEESVSTRGHGRARGANKRGSKAAGPTTRTRRSAAK